MSALDLPLTSNQPRTSAGRKSTPPPPPLRCRSDASAAILEETNYIYYFASFQSLTQDPALMVSFKRSLLPACLPADVWEREPEAGGCDPPEGDPDPPAGLFPLLGHPHQHRSPSAGRPAEPRGGQVSSSARPTSFSTFWCRCHAPLILFDCTRVMCPLFIVVFPFSTCTLASVASLPSLTQLYVKIFMPALPVSLWESDLRSRPANAVTSAFFLRLLSCTSCKAATSRTR